MPALNSIAAPPPAPPPQRLDVWRADDLQPIGASTTASGWSELDAELPGRGWPRCCLVDVLGAQPSTAEFRLLGHALKSVSDSDGQVVLVGPPKSVHAPGICQLGLDPRQVIWLEAQQPSERLWVTEQLIRANAGGAVLAWLPQARADQIRRLQVAAQSTDGLFFTWRPDAARHEASAAPLRVLVSLAGPWTLEVHLLKRRGPVHTAPLLLRSIPTGLESVLAPRHRQPVHALHPVPASAHAVDRAAPRTRQRLVAVQ